MTAHAMAASLVIGERVAPLPSGQSLYLYCPSPSVEGMLKCACK
jgi:hypothetical protein